MMTTSSEPRDAAGRPVVVGIDGSESALDAARWAAAEAQRRGAPLRLVTAYPWTRDTVVGVPGLGEEFHGALQLRAEHAMAAAVAAVEGVAPGRPVDRAIVIGYPIGVLAEEARGARLLVLGSRGLGGLTGLLAGSVTVALAARAAAPVVVVRGDRAAASGPVVVGVDDSPTSDAAIGFAFEAAAVRGAPLVAVHTWLEHVTDAEAAAMVDWAPLAAYEQTVAANRIAAWADKYPDVPVTTVVEHDAPARALVERSTGAQLLVVGSRGRANLAGLLLGSVSHAVVQRAHCPVAVVRPDTD
jgi:nucleotide-binding universal stress UspA family protein